MEGSEVPTAARLPPAVRRRFTKRLGEGESAVYAGRVVETQLTRLGWLLAQVLRLVGAPLPTARVFGMPYPWKAALAALF